MVCLDTDIIIDFFRKDKQTLQKIGLLEKQGMDLSMTTISSFEIWRGTLQPQGRESVQEVNHFLENITLFDFTLDASKKSAEIFEQLKSQGGMIELTDIMIAAICISKNEPLLTRNTKHFERIPGLKLEPFS